jgi:hypothetical protein
MARVPLHFRGKLASSQTGPNSLDTSAADKARAVTQMADGFQKVAVQFEAKKREDLMKSAGTKAKVQYANIYADKAREIKKEFASNPDAGYEALQVMDGEVRDQVLSGVSDSRLRSDLGPIFDSISATKSANSKTWQIGQMDMLDRQFIVDVEGMYVDMIIEGASEDDFDAMMSDEAFTEENYTRVYGIETGAKNFKTAKDTMFRARATTMTQDGKFFSADKFIEQSDLPSLTTKKEVEANFIRMQKGAEAQEFFRATNSASVSLLETQQDMLADDITPAELDDRVLQISDQANQATNPKTKAVLAATAQILADIRDVKMENILLTAPGNTEVEASLQFAYEGLLLPREEGRTTKDPTAYLSDFVRFQGKVAREAKKGNVSAAHYNKWMWWSKVALQNLDFEQTNGFFGDIGPTMPMLDQSKNTIMNNHLRSLLNDNTDQTNAWRTKVLDVVYKKIPIDQMDDLTEEAVQLEFDNAKTIATLQELGYPVSTLGSKMIKTPAGNFPWAGNDQDGMPLVTIDPKTLEK